MDMLKIMLCSEAPKQQIFSYFGKCLQHTEHMDGHMDEWIMMQWLRKFC